MKQRLSRHLPNEYDFTPRTWLLPNEYNAWFSYASNKPKKDCCAYILKPNNGAMGHGYLVELFDFLFENYSRFHFHFKIEFKFFVIMNEFNR